MSTLPKPYLTPEEYLAIDRAAEYRSEYFDGDIFPVAATTMSHARIHHNLSRVLGNQLEGRSCEVVGPALRVQTRPKGPYFYPDIVVFCGKPKLVDKWRDMIIDATVIIEILSPSTQGKDRGFKFEQYRRLPSLTDFIAIAQDRGYLEHSTRQLDATWNLREISDLNAVLQLPSIECSLRVAEAYSRVEFEPES
jgi:Uma2 family endonuclease